MKTVAFLLAFAAAVYGQTSPAPSPTPAPTPAAAPAPAPANPASTKLLKALDSGTAVKTVLTKAVNAGDMTAGQEINFKTVEVLTLPDGTKVPADSKIVAKVFDVKSKAKGDPMTVLAVTLASIQSKDGAAIPIHGHVKAFAPPEAVGATVDPGTMAGEQTGGGARDARVDPNAKIGKDPEKGETPVLTHNHVGSGIQGVELLHGFVGETLVSALRSADKSFKIPASAQFVFSVSK